MVVVHFFSSSSSSNIIVDAVVDAVRNCKEFHQKNKNFQSVFLGVCGWGLGVIRYLYIFSAAAAGIYRPIYVARKKLVWTYGQRS